MNSPSAPLCGTALLLMLPLPGAAEIALQDVALTPHAVTGEVSHAAVAVVGGVDQARCSAIAIGENSVLTAARCVIDPQTGRPIPDRQVIAGIDMTNGFMIWPRFFSYRIYIPDPGGPFGAGSLADQPAVLKLRKSGQGENDYFGYGAQSMGFHRTGSDPDPERLHSFFYPNGQLAQMRGEGCKILSILGDGRMRLTCDMTETGTGAALLAPTGIVGIYLEPGVGHFLGRDEIADLDLIARDKVPEHFTAVPNEDEKGFATVVLGNQCSRTVEYFLRYQAMDAEAGDFSVETGSIAAGGREIVPIRTDNWVVYLAGEGAGKKWGNDIERSGRYYDEIELNRWGDYFTNFSCD